MGLKNLYQDNNCKSKIKQHIIQNNSTALFIHALHAGSLFPIRVSVKNDNKKKINEMIVLCFS